MTTENIKEVSLKDEMKSSYIDYAMSVVIARAIPDVRDGLKPVHRRIIYAMADNNYFYNQPHVKSPMSPKSPLRVKLSSINTIQN